MSVRTRTETIAAIATPPGAGGVGIVRVSGPEALPLLKKLFQPHRPLSTFASHRLYYGTIFARNGALLDEVLAVYMQAPHTYTREDVVEFQCHASPLVLQELLEHLFTLGARPAEPGEFTKRAFLSGRIDLSQAEAVIDLLEARSATGAGLAASQLQGTLAYEIAGIRATLIELMAHLEVAIDFPDEDADIFDRHAARAVLQERVLDPIRRLIADADHGRIYREGARLVLAGLPNAGKSSLLNALLREERALVTPVPGTTRDSIEEVMILGGIPVQLIDTAGIRSGQDDPVEALGVERARKMIDSADCVLFLIDAHAGFTQADQELHASIRHKRQLLVLNKRDLITLEQELDLHRQLAETQKPVVSISARSGEGMEELHRAILELILPSQTTLGETARFAPNRRHRSLLSQALNAGTASLNSLNSGAPLDLLSVDLQTVLDCIGGISGHSSPEEVLDAVFSRFCIGK
ncbi:MAG: tRNA uridine-5-carboxymethylaminomethyl(34) synthesis GTPase MnmE [bacterium]|nr:tRNA uridine-5-carboxymethylaminomethyl(34) synthesis GTPase MnmE [bacterium]